ncbi:tetratricopeptide repeat protein (macronuclear) [Tetrahymena thermophila SB210]|uniref:Tetratricopeptide repeat protein n=1 Tax=Tetrahymena thermophila (strain SB210) TaxID=312017 RepID=Q239P6_TETTS|nr:tetratricopeptide repeat protein [Tetrahymena thermophila SB210]EAR93269.1 tetratricopeptide repeat protein [Tetrahymena thermophila SB210]|eukprot:XP_001013514.1 tetratricopeptide repeat protein [Tetrahymena thermophila SB210]
MNSFEIDLMKQVKLNYLNYEVQKCIDVVDQHDQDRSLLCHQTLQLYKTLSLFELSQFKQANQCFQKMIEEREKIKGDKVDSIDVLTTVLCLIQIFYINVVQTEMINQTLLKIYEAYREQNENNESYELGIYLLGKGTYQYFKTNREEGNLQCIADLEKAHELLDDYKQDIMSFLTWIYYNKQKIDEAEKWGQLLYNLNPKFPGIANNLAIIFNQKGLNEKVEQLYKEAEQNCPNNHVILHNLANYYSENGNPQKEQEYYKRSYDIQPRSAQSCHKYGRFLYLNDQIDEAIKILNEGISIDPEILENYDTLAQIAIDSDDADTAITNLNKCIEISPEDGYYYSKLGDCYEVFERYEEAIVQYRLSQQKQNYQYVSIMCNSNIAFCYFRLGKYSNSLEEFFNAFNKQSSYYNYSNEIQNINYIINKKLVALKKVIEIINKQQEKFILKIEQITKDIADNNIKGLFQYKLDTFREHLQIQAYKKYIQENLTFQSQYSHFDLYLD